jgi:hypothetical protein
MKTAIAYTLGVLAGAAALSAPQGALAANPVRAAQSRRAHMARALTITHGTGRYGRAHGHGGFYGVINRANDAVTVQTTGTLAY